MHLVDRLPQGSAMQVQIDNAHQKLHEKPLFECDSLPYSFQPHEDKSLLLLSNIKRVEQDKLQNFWVSGLTIFFNILTPMENLQFVDIEMSSGAQVPEPSECSPSSAGNIPAESPTKSPSSSFPTSWSPASETCRETLIEKKGGLH